jgi:catechol 2,3-dioxygenase-like lactoylglutathione lyase family enzyme
MDALSSALTQLNRDHGPSNVLCLHNVIAICAAVIMTLLGGATTALAQGRCIRAYGTSACNTDPIKPVFERTGWRTTGLDHITFRVAEPHKEAAFYAALMGWRMRSNEGARVVMDVGNWGTVIFQQVPSESFVAPVQTNDAPAQRPAVRAVVEGYGFSIEPWDGKTIEQELRKRGLNPVADNDGKGFESFHVKDPDGFDLQIANDQGHVAARKKSSANAKAAVEMPFEATGWQTVWLDHFSFNVANYKASASFYTNLLGWGPTYDEGSQNELMIGDVGEIIIRGGNPLNPGQAPNPRAGQIDHISFGISPWDTDAVKAALEQRGLNVRVDTSDGSEIHVAQYKSYHTVTPNGYNLQISYSTHNTRLNLAIAVNPRRPGVR